jgi:hypothetical protein
MSFSRWAKHLLYVARRPCIGAPWGRSSEASPKPPWSVVKARHAAASVEVQGWGKVRFRVALGSESLSELVGENYFSEDVF